MKSKATIEYIISHLEDDPRSLLLNPGDVGEADLKIAVNEIILRKKAKTKLPSWFNNFEIEFPHSLNFEQSSSELTAIYKQKFCNGGDIADITGGFGVDSYFLSKKAGTLYYFEIDKMLCDIARHNFKSMEVSNIIVNNNNFTDFKGYLPHFEMIYADPSRRVNNERVFSLRDYKPSIPEIKDYLLKLSGKLLVKVSPMADIKLTLADIPETNEIHIISVDNECKELLFLIDKESASNKKTYFAVNLSETPNKNSEFIFNMEDEENSKPNYEHAIFFRYLYEPGASQLKAGAFKITGCRYDLNKLHKNSHLYSSNSLNIQFPGRIFEVLEIIDFNNRSIKLFSKSYPKCNIATRNFPLSVKELRHRLKTDDGGEIFVFGTTLIDESRKLIICRKAI